ncbi:MAG: protein-L-isoaspartate(D-aspartate) O-methyltransferase [Armatimonadota bacterium]|jgi:protein-L-isoaspartate(D-aspartate) O-methyltransferase
MASGRVADTYGGYRARLVEQLRAAGITDLAVLRAFGETPRHLFVPEALRARAYDDASLPIGHGQTISQPSTQARYLQALELTGHERVLEIGSGSGYQAALLAFVAARVVTVERIAELAKTAREALERAAIGGVQVVVGDGSLGWRPEAPYDAILVAAASPSVPEPLLRQLAPGGRLVIPLVRGDRQELVRVTQDGSEQHEGSLGDVRFVPLIGRYGHHPEEG